MEHSMNCPNCRQENSDSVKYCNECGYELGNPCPNCGNHNPAGSKFCNECGRDLRPTEATASVEGTPSEAVFQETQAKSALPVSPAFEGERKYVTVLFSDLSGYTAMSERLDPEEVKEIMDRIFGDISQIVYKYEGFIEKFIGDAVMALFGVPQTHEDDPIRAIRAAIEMHAQIDHLSPEYEKRIGKPLALHSGIHTGLVVTGDVDMTKGTHGVLGDTINLASRFMGLAQSGDILIGQNTYRQVEEYFNFEDLGRVKVKGKAEEVQVYRVKSFRPVSDSLRLGTQEGIRSPLIGRDNELSVLYGCLEGLTAGQGSIVSVIGEAGIGKSRLIGEIFDRSKQERTLKKLKWFEGDTLSYGQTISYWPFIDIFRRYAGITEEDSETSAWSKLKTRISDLLEEQAEEILPYIASLMNISTRAEFNERIRYLDGEAMGRQVFLATYRFFEKLSKNGPVVLLFEDLHWMDESSAALLEHIMPLVNKNALLILGLYRPDPDTSANSFRRIANEKYPEAYHEIRLEPLPASASLQLVDNLLKLDDRSRQVFEKITEKAGGNPFFIEEIIRSLLATEAFTVDAATGHYKATHRMETISIPDTIHGVISARLDRLDKDLKTVLRLASVIGRSFLYRIMQAIGEVEVVLDQALGQLQSVEIIREKRKTPELEYIFNHALVQEATYESILLQRRRGLHAQVGRVIEALFSERLEAFYGLLAYHYARAEEWDKAHHYLMKVGDQAGKIAADAEALAHYQQALATYEHAFGDRWDPLQRVSLERKIGTAHYRRGEMQQALEYLHRCLDLLGKPIQTSRWAVRRGILGAILRHIGHRLFPWLHPRPGSKPLGPEVEEEDRIYVPVAWIYGYFDPEKFMLTVLRRLNASESSGYAYGIASVSTGMGFICDMIPIPMLGGYYHRKSVVDSEKLNNPEALGLACFGLAYYEQLKGNWQAAIEQGKRGAAAYRTAGDLRGYAESVTYGILYPYIYKGHYEKALSQSEELIRLGNEGDDPTILARGLHIQGLAQRRMGKFQDAIPALRKASELTESIPDYFGRSDTGGQLGQCYLCQGEWDVALDIFEKTEQIIIAHRVPIHFVHFYNCLADAYLVIAEQNENNDKADWLKKAKHACRQALKGGKGSRAKLPEAMMLQGRYLWLKGKPRQALKWWQRSRVLAEELEIPYELGRIHREMGVRLKDRAHLDQAKTLFSEIKAESDYEQTNKCCQNLTPSAP